MRARGSISLRIRSASRSTPHLNVVCQSSRRLCRRGDYSSRPACGSVPGRSAVSPFLPSLAVLPDVAGRCDTLFIPRDASRTTALFGRSLWPMWSRGARQFLTLRLWRGLTREGEVGACSKGKRSQTSSEQLLSISVVHGDDLQLVRITQGARTRSSDQACPILTAKTYKSVTDSQPDGRSRIRPAERRASFSILRRSSR